MVDVFSAEEITSVQQLFNPDEWIATGKTHIQRSDIQALRRRRPNLARVITASAFVTRSCSHNSNFATMERSLKHLVVPPRRRTRPLFVWQQQRFVFNPLFFCSLVPSLTFYRNFSTFETRPSQISVEFMIIFMSQMSRHSTRLTLATSSSPCALGSRMWFWAKVLEVLQPHHLTLC